MLALPVLKSFAFCDQFDELVVTYLPVLVRGPNTGFCQTACNGTRLLAIHRTSRSVTDAMGERANDTLVIQGTRLAPLEGGGFGSTLQAVSQRG